MNEILRPGSMPMTSQAAEGLPRRRWSVAEIKELTRTGFFQEDDRFELIGGEIVPMNAKGLRHELLRHALIRHWVRTAPDHVHIGLGTTFRMREDTFVEPDFVFYRKSDGLAKLNPRTALFAVEVADTSLGYDLGRKPRIYASFGVPEVWVIDAIKLITHRHAEPGLDGYAGIAVSGSGDVLTPACAPEMAVTLDRLELI
jgi:Uma2 family endonuclease